MKQRHRAIGMVLIGMLTMCWPFQATPGQAAEPTSPAAYPLKVSANHRYLIDQNGTPFMIVGDFPQALIGNVSLLGAKEYIRNRARHGINALWINLICNAGTGCNPAGTTFDGVAPFTTVGDLSTPNPAYFDRADEVIRLAAESNIVVFLDPIETSDWFSLFLGRTESPRPAATAPFWATGIGTLPNIVWQHGNDFQTWTSAADDALAQAVAQEFEARITPISTRWS